MRLCPPALAIPSVQRGHHELLSRKYLCRYWRCYFAAAKPSSRGYRNDMFVCATFPKFIIDTDECFSLLQARKLPSNSGPPPLGSNMLMVDVFKLQNLFFPRHEGSHHHTGDFYHIPINWSRPRRRWSLKHKIYDLSFLSPPITALCVVCQ